MKKNNVCLLTMKKHDIYYVAVNENKHRFSPQNSMHQTLSYAQFYFYYGYWWFRSRGMVVRALKG